MIRPSCLTDFADRNDQGALDEVCDKVGKGRSFSGEISVNKSVNKIFVRTFPGVTVFGSPPVVASEENHESTDAEGKSLEIFQPGNPQRNPPGFVAGLALADGRISARARAGSARTR